MNFNFDTNTISTTKLTIGSAVDANAAININGGAVALATRVPVTTPYVHVVFHNPNGACGQIYTMGSTTTYATSSDYRLKKNEIPIRGDCSLQVIDRLKPYQFVWKSDGRDDVGFFAHELQQVVPQCVIGEKDGDEIQQVDVTKLIPYLVGAVQELKKEVDDLKRKIVLV